MKISKIQLRYILRKTSLISDVKNMLKIITNRGFDVEFSKERIHISYLFPSDTVKLSRKVIIDSVISFRTIANIYNQIAECYSLSTPNNYISNDKFEYINKLYTNIKRNSTRRITLELSSSSEVDYIIFTDLDRHNGYLLHPLFTKPDQRESTLNNIEKLLVGNT